MNKKTGKEFIKWFSAYSVRPYENINEIVWRFYPNEAIDQLVHDSILSDMNQVIDWLGLVAPPGMHIVSLKINAYGLTDRLTIEVNYDTSTE